MSPRLYERVWNADRPPVSDELHFAAKPFKAEARFHWARTTLRGLVVGRASRIAQRALAAGGVGRLCQWLGRELPFDPPFRLVG